VPIIFGTVAASILKKVVDTFTRTTSGSLGSATTGQSWTAKLGVWYANGSQAQSDAGTSANTAGAVATVDIGKANAAVSLGNSGATGVNPGTGVAFWSTAAGSWWGAISYSDQTISFYSCNCVSGCNPCSGQVPATYYCSQADIDDYVSPCSSFSDCYGTAASNTGVCSYTISNVPSNGTYPTCGCPSGYSGGTSYYSCQTCSSTSTNYYLQVLYSSTGSAAYTVQSTNTTASEVKSINVSTSGNNYSVTAYNSSYGSLGTWSGTNSGTKGTKHGIVKAFSSNAQGSTVDNFLTQGQ